MSLVNIQRLREIAELEFADIPQTFRPVQLDACFSRKLPRAEALG
jgi:hypothetical protein